MDEVMEETSATDFIRWVATIEREEWTNHSKQDYLLAAIVYEIQRIGYSIGGGPQPKPDAILKRFTDAKLEAEGKLTADLMKDIRPGDFETGKGAPGIEIGSPLDDKWKRVTQEAKAKWLAFVPAGAIVSKEGDW